MRCSEFLEKNYDTMLQIFNCMRVGVWITDGEGKVLMVNDDSMKAGGLTRDEILGKNMDELVDMGYIMQSATSEAIKSGKEESVIEEMGEGGACLSISIPLKYNGKIDTVICVERDISEIATLRSALEEQRDITEQMRVQLQEKTIGAKEDDSKLVANSYSMIRVKETAKHIGSLDATAIILGESGVGKELVADLIYESGKRVGKPFIKINCAAIPESLIESELFGYEGGAFTGAKKQGQKGMFEEADGGTIFLDEIGELPLLMQSKLLRVLENGEIRRIGASESKKVDVRIIAATNRNLKEGVKTGKFRDDLYYRLMVLPITIPPLKERKEDILPLASTFLSEFNHKYQLKKEFTQSGLSELMDHQWPGNVRELRNVVERLVVGSGGDKISGFQVLLCINGSQPGSGNSEAVLTGNITLQEMMDSYEEQIIKEAMEKCGTMSAAAKNLGVNKSTISRKLKAWSEKKEN